MCFRQVVFPSCSDFFYIKQWKGEAGPTKSSGLPPPHISPFGWNFTVPRRWVVSEKINGATGACFFLSTMVSLVSFGCFLHTKNRQNHVKYTIQVYKACYFNSTFDLFKPWLCLVFSSHEKVMEFSGEKSTTKIRGHILQSARNRQSSLVLEPWGVENPEMWWCVFLLDQCDFQWPPKIPQWYGKLTIRGSHYWDFLESPLIGGNVYNYQFDVWFMFTCICFHLVVLLG